MKMNKLCFTSNLSWNKLEKEFSRNCAEWGVPIEPVKLSELLRFRNFRNDAGITGIFQITKNPRIHRNSVVGNR